MANYSVATTKDNLSSLIDKALAGEEVVITRHGKPTVELRIVEEKIIDRAAAMDRLRQVRGAGPTMSPIPLHRFYEWLYEDDE